MASERTLEVPIRGMDCAECTEHVQHAIATLPVEDFNRRVLTLLGVVFGAVLFVVVVGEWLGLFEAATKRVPWPIWLVAVLVGGYPVFRNVIRSALKGQVISHTLMTVGVLAALAEHCFHGLVQPCRALAGCPGLPTAHPRGCRPISPRPWHSRQLISAAPAIGPGFLPPLSS